MNSLYSVHIAQYEEYTKPLIDHLISQKVNHWDTAIRELTAKVKTTFFVCFQIFDFILFIFPGSA